MNMLTKKQLKERQKGLGGSDAAAALGLSSWMTPLQLYNSKKKPVCQQSNERQDAGNYMEPAIKRFYAHKFKHKVAKGFSMTSREYDFIRGNIDGWIKDLGAILEVKNVDRKFQHKWGKPGTAQIPFDYYCQVAHYCYVFDAKEARIAAFFGGNELQEYIYKRDVEFETFLIERECKFWREFIVKNVEPADSCIDDLKEKYTYSKDTFIVASNDIANLVEGYKTMEFEIKALQEKQLHCKTRIMQFMKDNAVLRSPDQQRTLVSWKSAKPSMRINKSLLEANYPEIYKKVLVEGSPQRRFLIK